MAHGDVTPQTSTRTSCRRCEPRRDQNPYRKNDAARIGDPPSTRTARCRGWASGGIAPDLRKLDNDTPR
jgi:hypothetical protein